VLENGDDVHMVHFVGKSYSVDTPEDLAFVESQMTNDPLLAKYRG
jgi:CMP-2-keto-3-deoxyoctulosonic acid synthetase